jgi:hypothetical protein
MSQPWQVKDSLEELVASLDRNRETKPVAAFEASLIPTDVDHRFQRPTGSFIVVKEYLYFLSPEERLYGADTSLKLTAADVQEVVEAAKFVWDLYEGDPEAIVKLFIGVSGAVADVFTGKADERWLQSVFKGPNSVIIPFRAIERVTLKPNSKSPDSDSAKLEITTPQRSYWLFEDAQSLHDRMQPPAVQAMRLAYRLVNTAIFGWRPDLVKFLTETIPLRPASPTQPARRTTKPAAHKQRRRKS